MSKSIFDRYRRFCREDGLFVESAESHSGAYSRYRLHPAFGRGWMDIAHIGHDMTVGRAAYALDVPFRRTYEEMPDSVGIFVLLDGRLHVSASGARAGDSLMGGTLWLRDRRQDPGWLTYDLKAGDNMAGVSIDLPAALVGELLDEVPAGNGGALAGLMRQGGGMAGAPLTCRSCLATAHQLLAAGTASAVDRLRMESAALELVACLLGAGAPGHRTDSGLPRRQRAAVDETVAILREEFAEHHTIASLAGRVGMNQCYLKNAFRTLTGSTIADYLRDMRMRRARAMIEGGSHTVQEAALFVGYANPSHFAAAFRKVHGLSPSRLK